MKRNDTIARRPFTGRIPSPELLMWLVPLYLCAFVGWFMWKYAVDVPYWDSWELVELVTGREPVTWAALWAQSNEHHLVLQRVFELAWARLAGWNQRTATFFHLLCIGAAAVVFIRRALTDLPHLSTVQRVLLSATLSFWFFTLRQHELLLWSIVLCWTFLILVFVLFDGVWRDHLERGRRGWRLAALLAIAVLSTGQGLALPLFVICAALVSLWRGGSSHRRTLWLAVFSMAAIAVYLWRLVPPPHHPPISSALHRPLDALRFCAIYLGSPLSTGIGISLVVGLVIGGGALWAAGALVWRNGRGGVWELVVRHGLLGVSAIVMLAIMVGRVGFGPDFALSSRYVPFAVLFAAAALVLAVDQLAAVRPKAVTGVLAALLVATVPLWYLGYRDALHYGWVKRDVLTRYRDCVLADPENVRGCDGTRVYPVPEVLALRTLALRDSRLSFFSDSGTAGTPGH